MRKFLVASLVVLVGSLPAATLGQATRAAQSRAPAPAAQAPAPASQAHASASPIPAPASQPSASTSRLHLHAALGLESELVTVNGKTSTKGELLSRFDPAKQYELPSWSRGNKRTITAQELLEKYASAEAKMRASGTSLKAIALQKFVNPNAVPMALAQRKLLQQSLERLSGLKRAGWVSGWAERAPVARSAPEQPKTPLSALMMHGPARPWWPTNPNCDFSSGLAGRFGCAPDFSTIDAPVWSQDMGDAGPHGIGATSRLEIQGKTSGAGDTSTCSVDWKNDASVFNSKWDILHVNASETADASAQSFSGSLTIDVEGNTVNVGSTDEGSDGSLMDDTFAFSAGGSIPIAGPILLKLEAKASATVQLKLIGEHRLAQGDPSAPVGHGSHCHVGVEPNLNTEVAASAGVGLGIPDLIDVAYFDVKGSTNPIKAELPAHVTLDLLKTPPQGQIAFDAHLKATLMASRLWIEWQLFDVCVPLVGCILNDILQIPTKGQIAIADSPGWPAIDQDLAGGQRAILWHQDPSLPLPPPPSRANAGAAQQFLPPPPPPPPPPPHDSAAVHGSPPTPPPPSQMAAPAHSSSPPALRRTAPVGVAR